MVKKQEKFLNEIEKLLIDSVNNYSFFGKDPKIKEKTLKAINNFIAGYSTNTNSNNLNLIGLIDQFIIDKSNSIYYEHLFLETKNKLSELELNFKELKQEYNSLSFYKKEYEYIKENFDKWIDT